MAGPALHIKKIEGLDSEPSETGKFCNKQDNRRKILQRGISVLFQIYGENAGDQLSGFVWCSPTK